MLDVDMDEADDDADPDYVPEEGEEDYFETENEEDDEFPAENISFVPSASSSTSPYIGKNQHVWEKKPKERKGRAAPPKKQIFVPGSRSEATSLEDPLKIWKLFFDKPILEEILVCTNKEMKLKADDRASRGVTDQSYHGPLSYNELLATFGLLYLAGVQKSAKLHLDELWSMEFGLTIFRITMSQQRFEYILLCLRFDDRETRPEREPEDNFALIRNIWDKFVRNCTRLYSPSANMTVDEQLLSFRGNCGFRMYIPSKPAKYGIKIVSLNDAATGYMFNAIPYLGLSSEEREKKRKKKELDAQQGSGASTSESVQKKKAERKGPQSVGKPPAPKTKLLGENENEARQMFEKRRRKTRIWERK
jgi:hypothetical protein